MRWVGPLTVGGATLALGAVAVVGDANVHLPGNRQGYEPLQPLAFSHRLHAGDLKVDCLYCHFAAETSRRAGVPPAQVCMNCHAVVTTNFEEAWAERQAALKEKREPRRIVSPKLRPLYDALALDAEGKRDPAREPRPIEWVRVHDLPDFVWFPHSVHVARGVACQACHGAVQAMERVRQEADLSMGWCVACHRANAPSLDNTRKPPPVAVPPAAGAPAEHASTDCSACHY